MASSSKLQYLQHRIRRSRAALNSYTIGLAQELKKEGIKVNAATPGFTSTQLTGFNVHGKTTREGAKSLLSTKMDRLVSIAMILI